MLTTIAITNESILSFLSIEFFSKDISAEHFKGTYLKKVDPICILKIFPNV